VADKIKVIVAGALGKMGKEAVKAIFNEPGLELAGMVDVRGKGESMGDILALRELKMTVESDLDQLIAAARPDVMVDFTNPQAVFNNTRTALKQKVNCVIGTTGLNDMELAQLEKIALENQVGVAVIPNFALGAVLMMKLSQQVAQYFPDVEIIELHHDQKLDAPSGTAIKTAEMITANRQRIPARNAREFEKVTGARGGEVNGIRIHSVRLPGFVAHQEVIFGGIGQTLSIRHDSYDRVGFMPGVLLTINKITEIKGLVYGLENFL